MSLQQDIQQALGNRRIANDKETAARALHLSLNNDKNNLSILAL